MQTAVKASIASARSNTPLDTEHEEEIHKRKTERQEITLRDRIVLGPVDRYRKYNVFPWKFMVHLASIIVCSYQIQTIVTTQTRFTFSSSELWYNLFMTEPYGDGETALMGGTVPIYNIKQMQDFVQMVVTNYEKLEEDNMLEYIRKPRDSEGLVIKPQMVVLPVDLASEKIVRQIIPLSSDNLGPIDPTKPNSKVKAWLRRMFEFTVGFSMEVNYPTGSRTSAGCQVWNIT